MKSSAVKSSPAPLLLAALSAAVFALGSGCSRTPPEPTPSSAESAVASAPALASAAAVPVASTGEPSAKAAPPEPAANCPPDPEGNGHLPTAQVAFPDAPGRPKVEVEIARTPHDIERGLMYRRAMAEERGMLFRLDGRREHVFWMHNTCIPLDMMFVDDDGTIVGIVENATPMTDTERTVGKPSLFVLEVVGGYAGRHGIKAGQKLGLPAAAR